MLPDMRQADISGGPAGGKMSRWRRRQHRLGVLYVLPALALLSLMVAYPIGRSFYLSFFDYSILEPDSARFIGLDNYKRLVTGKATPKGDRPAEPALEAGAAAAPLAALPPPKPHLSQEHKAFINTMVFTAIFVPPYVILALLIAMALNALKRGVVVLRTIIFTPVVVSLAVSSVLFMLFYNPNFGLGHEMLKAASGWGPMPWLLRLVHLGPVPEGGILSGAGWATVGIVILCLWNGIGINVILFLVGLQRISEDLYEAARVDGAGAWQRFAHITLPQLGPTTFLVVLLSLIGAFKVFGQPFIMTGGGPEDSTLTFVMRLYKVAFVHGRFELGFASALAYALAVFIFAISLLVRRLNRPVE